MKKMICCLLAMLMLLSVLAGCGGKDEPEEETTLPATEAPTEEPTEAPTEEPTEPKYPATVIAQKAGLATVTVHSDVGTGSGFFIDDQGTLVTCYHVIDGTATVMVETSTGAYYPVDTIVDFNEQLDIAILVAGVSGNDYLEICNEPVMQGETVYALGSTRGLDGTFSNGIVSATERTIGVNTFIQTTAPISKGNSGGPLLNEKCEVIGINAKVHNNAENVGYAINISALEELAKDKNWTMNDYQEWFTKEQKRSYAVFDYETGDHYYSKINTYQYVTGSECGLSVGSWGAIRYGEGNMKEGYVDVYGPFVYAYDARECDQYTEYLKSIGFVFDNSEECRDWYYPGTVYYYYNEETGVTVIVYIFENSVGVVIEACYS